MPQKKQQIKIRQKKLEFVGFFGISSAKVTLFNWDFQ